MKRRVYGIENEYRVIQKMEIKSYRLIISEDPTLFLGFAANGARIYIDRGIPEYATPECTSVLDLIKCENAGNKIMFTKLKEVADILKSSRGWEKGCSGCHENYLINSRIVHNCRQSSSIFGKKSEKFKDLAELLIPFLVSRQILCGAGTIDGERSWVNYRISQRSNDILSDIGGSTLSNRPIINTRYEPHSSERYFRLHLILGDANLSEVSTFLKVGTTGIVLRMIEAGFLKITPILENSVYALHQISEDPTCKIAVKLLSGRKMTAINLQRWYLLKALKFFEDNSATNEEKLIVRLWGETLDKLKRDPMECDQEIDWVIKKRFIEWYQDKKGLALGDKRVRTVDYLYHHLDPKIGIYQKLLKKGKIKRLVSDEEVKKMITSPPQNTRAKLRGRLVKAVLEHRHYKINITVNWRKITIFIDGEGREILLEPFETENKKIELAIKEIKEFSSVN